MIGRHNRQSSCSNYNNNDPNIEVSVSHRLRGDGSSVFEIPIDALVLAYQSAGSALLIFLEAVFDGFFTLLAMLSLIVLAMIALADF